jgi:hypothetical protein
MIGGAPKLAAFRHLHPPAGGGLLPLAIDWQQMLGLLAIGSLLVGNLAAIAQTNLKRMLAYSTISQMGFVLLGLMSGVVNGNTLSAANAYSSAMFYVITYVLTTLATFGIILLAGARRFRERRDHRPGWPEPAQPAVCRRHGHLPVLAGGHPATGGLLCQAGGAAGAGGLGPGAVHRLAVFAVMMSLIGAFYYLRVVKVMYFDAPITATTVSAPAMCGAVLSVNGLLVLVLGIVPGGLMALCAQAIVKTLGTAEAGNRRRPRMSQTAVHLAGDRGRCSSRPICRSSTTGCWASCRWPGPRPGWCGWRAGGAVLHVGASGCCWKSAWARSPQGWEFYAVTGALFITLAFPGFVWRYLVKHRD